MNNKPFALFSDEKEISIDNSNINNVVDLRMGDCYKLLKHIPTKSIDFVLTDPPYDLENHGGGKSNLATKTHLNHGHIDFISNSFDMEKIFQEIERICKVVNLVVFCSNKQISKIMSYWENKKYSVSLMVWDKPNPLPFGNGKYISNLEFIIYVRGKNAPFNNTGFENQLKTFRYYPPSPNQRLHPTEKPIQMLERLIKNHSNEGNTILDMFMGSCTTGIACINTNRNFIGIEIDSNFFDISKKRIQERNKIENFELKIQTDIID